MDYGRTKVIQVTNIAPQATRDQMHTLFSHLGKIEDLRLYPSVRDASVTVAARVCFLKFIEESVLPISLHMTNTVFIDRAIIVQPFMNGDIPDELSGLEFANSSLPRGEPRLPPHVSNMTAGDEIVTMDENLTSTGLPQFPPLPATTENKIVEEIRRTVVVMGIGVNSSSQEVMEYFGTGAGEVKYFRWCAKDGGGLDGSKMAMIEFTDYGAIIPAMRLNNTVIGEDMVTVYFSSQAITKPQAKTNEAALKEIEEAMKKVKEAQNLVSAAVDPLMGMLGVKGKASRSRSRTPSRARDYYRRSRSRDRGSRRRSRSRDRYRRRSRSRDRRRSRSRERRRRSKSKRRSRSKKRSRTRSKDRKRETEKTKSEKDMKQEKEESKDPVITEESVNGDTDVKSEDNGVVATNGSEVKKSKSRSKSRKKSRSRERRRSRSKERKKSRSRSRKRSKRSRSRDRKKKSRSRERRRSRSRSREKKRSRSRDHKHKKSKHGRKSKEREERDSKKEITRDYDQEEMGYESGNKGGAKEEKHEAVDMEISNSP